MRNARNMNTHLDDDALSDISEAREDYHQTSMTVRNMRISDPVDKLADEVTEQILNKLGEPIQKKTKESQEEKTKALSRLREIFIDTQQALDVAYTAGILATQTSGHAREDSIQYAANFPDRKMKEVLGKARIYLKSTITKISDLAKEEYNDSDVPELTNSFLQHWLEADASLVIQARELMKQLKNTLKRSYNLAKDKALNPIRLGARPEEPGYRSNAYPSVPTTLEEEVSLTPGNPENKFVDTRKVGSKNYHVEQGAARSGVHNETTGQPPDYNQSMRLQPIIPQPTNQFQYGYQINDIGLNQQQLSSTNQQNFLCRLLWVK